MEHLGDDDLAAYVEGSASPETVSRIDAHIDGCADCRRLFVAVVFGSPSAAPTRRESPGTEPASGAFECGATILGKYRVERVLGEGGMGRVLLVHDTALDRSVAIKVMRDDLALDGMARARFEREAKMIARLTNEHAVRVHDVGSLGPMPFIVMEYVDGSDLRTRVKEDGPLAPKQAARFVADACSALAEAHRAGIVHRDIKPQNLLLSRDGKTKVVDFGIAKQTDAAPLSRTGAVLGTVSFMSPEQIAGRTVDARADVWSLGATLFYLVTGKPPFDGSDRTSSAPHMDDARLDAIIARCLADKPEERWPSAAQLGEALERYLDAPRTSSRPVLLAVVGLSIVSIAVLGWLVAHARPTTEAIKPSPSIPTSTSSPLASTSMPSAVTTIIASAAPSSSASATPARSHCTCLADGWRLCKPELEETLCECHDTDGSLLFAKSDEVNDAAKARRKVPATSPSALVGTPCSGFASVIPKGETTARAKAGTGTYRPCSRDCSAWNSFSGHEHDACNGLDEYGRPRSGALHCN